MTSGDYGGGLIDAGEKSQYLPLFRQSLQSLRRQSKACLLLLENHVKDDPLSPERSNAAADVTKLAFQLHVSTVIIQLSLSNRPKCPRFLYSL